MAIAPGRAAAVAHLRHRRHAAREDPASASSSAPRRRPRPPEDSAVLARPLLLQRGRPRPPRTPTARISTSASGERHFYQGFPLRMTTKRQNELFLRFCKLFFLSSPSLPWQPGTRQQGWYISGGLRKQFPNLTLQFILSLGIFNNSSTKVSRCSVCFRPDNIHSRCAS